jgi:hypothetical protein
MRDHCRELALRLGREPEDLVEWWAERAAIRELEGGLPRDEAERAAFEDLRAAYDTTSLAGEDRHGPRAVTGEVTARKREER